MSESPQNPKIPLQIIRDTREQDGFSFVGFPCTVETGTLATADYSLVGFTDRIGIERKSLPDLVACLGVERDRFQRELARLRGFDAACIIVDQPQSVLRLGHFRSRMDAGAAWQSCLALSMRFRVPFFWAENRADAERICFDCLRHFARDRWRELQALRLVPTMTPERTERHRPGAGMDGKPNPPERRQRAANGPPSRAQAGTGAGT